MKRLACLLLACLTALALTSCGAAKTQELSLFAMDTYMTLSAVGDGAADALARASQEINALEAALSRTIDTSDVSRLNRDGSAVWSQDSADLLALARQYSTETDGAFDVTVAPLVELWAITSDAPHVPTQAEIDALLPLVGTEHIHQDGTAVSLDAGCAIDLGGIAKGYASDRVAARLAARQRLRLRHESSGQAVVRGHSGSGKQRRLRLPAAADRCLCRHLRRLSALLRG